MFGDTVKGINLSVDDTIAVGQTFVWRGMVDYNQFSAADEKLASTDLEKLKVQWVPEKVLMKDGTKMDVPEVAMR